MDNIRKNERMPWLLLAAVALFSLLVVAAGGAVIYWRVADACLAQKKSELSSIAALKTQQATDWIADLVGDSALIAGDPFLRENIAASLKDDNEGRVVREKMDVWLTWFVGQHGLYSGQLLSPDGKVLAGSLKTPNIVAEQARKLLIQAKETGREQMSEMHGCQAVARPHIEIVFPVWPVGADKTGEAPAFLMLRPNPEKTFFPSLQKWPVVSASGEVLLVHRDGDRVVYLNSLRFRQNASLGLSFPLSQIELSAVQAVLGNTGSFIGADYRGKPVLSHLIAVPGTEWKIITKMNLDEVYAPMRRDGVFIWSMAVLAWVVSCLAAAFVWYAHVSRLRRERVDLEHHKSVLMQHFDLVMRHATDIILLVDDEKRIVEANDHAISAYGYGREEIIGMPVAHLRPPGGRAGFYDAAESSNSTVEAMHCRKDGSLFPVEVGIHEFELGKHKFYQAIVRDITERKRAEAAIQQERDQAQAYLNVAGAMIVSTDTSANITMINQAGARILGYDDPAELAGKNWYDTVVPVQEREERRTRYTRVIKSGTVEHAGRPSDVDAVVTRTGEERMINFNDTICKDAEGQSTGMIFSGIDVTEQMQVRQQLEYMNRVYVMLSDINQAIFRVHGRDELFEMVCDIIVRRGKFKMAWIGLLDAETGEVRSVAHAGVSDGYVELVKAVADPGKAHGQGPTGQAVYTKHSAFANDIATDPHMAPWREQALQRGYRSSAAVPLLAGGQVVGALSLYAAESNFFREEEAKLVDEIGADLSYALERLRQDDEHRRLESERFRLAMVVEQAAEGVVITDMEGRIIYINPAFEHMSGYSRVELIGQNPRIIKSGKQAAGIYAEMWKTLFDGKAWHGQLINRRKDGTFYDVENVISPIRDEVGKTIGFVATSRDITREKQLENQFLQSQKMETVGRLAGGVAHDFNNILQVIMGFCTMLLEGMSQTDRHRADLEEIQRAGRRAADLTRQLLAFSRKQVIEFRVMDANAVITGMSKMLTRLLGESIRLNLNLAADLNAVRADAGQVEQVLMNLAVNARDAMPEGGELKIGTENVSVASTERFADPDARNGNFIVITVSDEGHGLTEEVRSHLFEPFFTTKGVGKGTGMGLATVYGIVKQHEGWIHVESEPGRGASFQIYLPSIAEKMTNTAPAQAEGAAPRGLGQRILLVEDEPSVRQLAQRVLSINGYMVSAASGVNEAYEMFNSNMQFDLLLSDVVLEDGTGLALAEQFQRLKPGLPVVMCSGYADDESRRELINNKGYRFLHKPYRQAELLFTVSESLAAAAKKNRKR